LDDLKTTFETSNKSRLTYFDSVFFRCLFNLF